MAQSWWQQLGSNQKKIVIILPIVVVVIITGVIVGVAVGTSGNRNKKRVEIDAKEKVNQRAKSIQSAMNPSMDPCKDFYNFTCKYWENSLHDETALLPTKNTFSLLQLKVYKELKEAFDEKLQERNLPSAQQKLLDAYKSCISESKTESEFIKELGHLLKEVGGWPMGDQSWKENEYDIDVGIATAIKKAGTAPLVGFIVLPDTRNTTRNIITLLVPDITEAGFNDPTVKYALKMAIQYLQAVVPESFEHDMQSIILLEEKLRNIIAKSLQAQEKQTRQFKIKDLKTVIKGVDFIEFFQVVTNASLNNMKEFLTEDDDIAIMNVAYLQGLAELVQSNKYPLRTYANYIGAHIILKYMMLVLPIFIVPGYSYQQQSLTYSRAPASWMPCLSVLSVSLNYATDRVYVDYLGVSSKADEKGEKMLDYISKAFETLATKSDWLDVATLSAVKEKLHAMRKHVGYPHWILNDEELDSYYETLPTMDSRFSTNVIKIAEFGMEKSLRKLRELNNLNAWPDLQGLTTTMVNAFYILPYNSINFPIAIQNAPLYDPDFPWYLNFGAIGAVIGHEITHGFDSKGSTLDKNGNIHNWWSEKAKEHFDQKAQCFVNQYNNYFDAKTHRNVNGTLTLAENIADNGGLRQAYLAYQLWEKEFGKEQSLPGLEEYTPYQLLFIAYGNMWCATYDNSILELLMKQDEHTPSPYRVWGAVSNSKEFANTFNCFEGQEMSQQNKCIIW